MKKKRWADMSAGQKIGVIIAGTIQFGLLAAGLWDLAHRTPDEVRGDRRLWAGLMFVNWLGPLAYFTYGRKKPLCSCSCCGTNEPAAVEETEQVDEMPAV
jgi:hypothetical protein